MDRKKLFEKQVVISRLRCKTMNQMDNHQQKSYAFIFKDDIHMFKDIHNTEAILRQFRTPYTTIINHIL